eukprot:jgi/Botrbrau1/2155/Bobra.0093s0056.1
MQDCRKKFVWNATISTCKASQSFGAVSSRSSTSCRASSYCVMVEISSSASSIADSGISHLTFSFRIISFHQQHSCSFRRKSFRPRLLFAS